MTALTKDQIFASSDRPIKSVEVPLWGGSVSLKTLSIEQREEVENRLESVENDSRGLRVWLIRMSVVDDNGNLIFNEGDSEKIASRGAKSIDIVFSAIQELNGLGEEQLKEAAGNSEAGQ